MHRVVNGTRYIISYYTTFANNFTNKKPAYHFNGNESVDSSFLQNKQDILLPTALAEKVLQLVMSVVYFPLTFEPTDLNFLCLDHDHSSLGTNSLKVEAKMHATAVFYSTD